MGNDGMVLLVVAFLILLCMVGISLLEAWKIKKKEEITYMEREILKIKAQQRCWEAIKQKNKNRPRFK